MNPAFKDVKEAAVELGIAISSLRRMASAGRVPCIRVGGHERSGKIMLNVDQVREHLLKQASN